MDARTFFQNNPKTRVEAVAKKAGTTYGNFQQIAMYNGAVSRKLAKALAEASDNEMTIMEILFPNESVAAG